MGASKKGLEVDSNKYRNRNRNVPIRNKGRNKELTNVDLSNTQPAYLTNSGDKAMACPPNLLDIYHATVLIN